MLMLSRASSVLLVASMFLLSTTSSYSQVTTADVVGTVTDVSGAVMANAKATITNTGTGQVRTTQTNASGDYAFTLLEPGSYSLKIEAPSFQTFSVQALTLGGGDRARQNASMQPGQSTTIVEVTATSPLLQSDSSVLQDVINVQAVQDLPLNGRNFVQLAQLTVGANEGPAHGLTSGQRPDDRRQSSAISVNGQSDVINDEMVDGLDNNERVIGTLGVRPSIEAIDELRVQTNDYTAEVGRTAGGVINVITRSGTNQFHGSVYEYFRNDALDANSFQLGASLPTTELRQNQYGGSVGGPIVKNKTFFFADYEGFRLVQGQNPQLIQVPSLAQYQAIRNNPASLLPAGVSTVDPVGLAYAMLFPAPNAVVNGTPEFTASPSKTQFSSTADGRIDHHFNDSNTLFVRWSYNNVQSIIPDIFPRVSLDGANISPGGIAFGFTGPAKDFAQQFQANYVHLFGPNLLLSLTAGYTRINNFSAPPNTGTDAAEKIGMPGINFNPSNSGLPQLLFYSGLGGLGDSPFTPIHDIDNTFQYSGTVSYTRGKQTIKFGASLIRRQAVNAQDNFGQGFFQIASLSDLIGGQVASEQRVNELYEPYWRFWEPSVFVQDDWHVRPWLTLNLGLRYEVFTPQEEKYNHESNFDPATATLVAASSNNPTAGVKTYYNNWMPRIGFAATAGKGFVIRGGFGTSYFPMNYTSNASLKNPPFVFNFANCSVSTCPAPYGTLAAGLPIPTAQPINLPTFTGSLSDNIAPNFHPSYLEQTNLTLQKSFGSNVITASYVGMFGRHLAEIINDLDAPAPGNGPRPYAAQLPLIGQIGEVLTEGNSSYNALQLAFQRRLSKGLSIDANYTWAHALDDTTGLSEEGANGYGLIPSAIATVDRGNSDLDIRHRFAFSANYQLPFGNSLHGFGAALVKGWQINGLASWETGLPFTVVNSSNIAEDSLSNQTDRPDAVGSPTLGSPTLGEFFNTAAFVQQSAGTVGTEGRNDLHGPHFRHVDMSVFKDFPIHEAMKIQLRAECFNISNTPSFANLAGQSGATLGNGNFGQITGLNVNYTPREFQFVMKFLF